MFWFIVRVHQTCLWTNGWSSSSVSHVSCPINYWGRHFVHLTNSLALCPSTCSFRNKSVVRFVYKVWFLFKSVVKHVCNMYDEIWQHANSVVTWGTGSTNHMAWCEGVSLIVNTSPCALIWLFAFLRCCIFFCQNHKTAHAKRQDIHLIYAIGMNGIILIS